LKTKSVRELSIQISLSGLSFCIIDSSLNRVEFLKSENFENKQTPESLLGKLKTIFDTHSIFESGFQSVICIHQNELNCLVPKDYFDDKHLAEYLKFNAKILKTDFISYDKVECISAYNVYVPLININNLIFEKFGSFTYKHSASVLIESVVSTANATNKNLVVHINTNTFELLFLEDKKLRFYNIFQYYTPEDFMYYLLFSIEQLALDTETVKLYLIGKIEEDSKLFRLIYKYVRCVEIMAFEPSSNISGIELIGRPQNHFLIFNSFN